MLSGRAVKEAAFLPSASCAQMRTEIATQGSTRSKSKQNMGHLPFHV